MSKRDPHATLRQIATHGRHAQDLCAGKTLPELLSDWKNVLAFERALEVLGESRQETSGGNDRRLSCCTLETGC